MLQHVRNTLEGFAGPEGGGLLAEMQASVERMFGLVTGALTVASMESGGESSTGMGLFLAGELALRIGAKLICVPNSGGGSAVAVSLPNPGPASQSTGRASSRIGRDSLA